MYYCDINSYYAGKIVQYIQDNCSKKETFCYGLPYDHKNGWRDDQDIYEIDVIMEIVADRILSISGRKPYISCQYLPYGWQIVVEAGNRDEL
jgi:hypothetical protein